MNDQKLAKVDDVIELGEPIPSNVAQMRDAATVEPNEHWERSNANPQAFRYLRMDGTFGPETSVEQLGDWPKWWPMRVLAVTALARIGDVIEHGEDIPANVTVLQDVDGDDWGNEAGEFVCRDAVGATFEAQAYWPMTVVEVNPVPQPAERESMTCWSISAHVAHDWSDAQGAWHCTGKYPESVAQPAERRLIGPAHTHLDAPCTDACYEPARVSDVQRVRGALSRLGDEPSAVAAFERIAGMLTAGAIDRDIVDRVADLLDVGHNEDVIGRLQYRLGEASTQPTESDPLVLTLPEVPEDAVALVDRMDRRWTPARSGANWEMVTPDGELTNWRTLGNLMQDFGPLTPEMAPPREPRTWPKLDFGTGDLPVAVEVEGKGRWVLGENGRTYHRPGTSLAVTLTLPELTTLGEVREVLDA